MVLSSIAFLFLYLFLRRLDVSVPLASLAALIFTFANNLYLKSNHLQHFAVYYIPVIVYCGLVAVSDVHRRPFRAYLLAAFAAGLYGLLFSTGYYMAWFFGLGLLIFTPIAVCIAWPQVQALVERAPDAGAWSRIGGKPQLPCRPFDIRGDLWAGLGHRRRAWLRRLPDICAHANRSRQCREAKSCLERLIRGCI